ncbi:MAG: hypothetical protein ACRDPE_15335 [Solirubrobacterales bacterium]
MADQSPHAGAPEVPLLGLEAQNALDAGLQKAGVFCSICGHPVEEGVTEMREYLIIEVRAADVNRPVVNLARIYHCQRESCDAAAVEAKAHATRLVPAWTLFAGPDEDPA